MHFSAKRGIAVVLSARLSKCDVQVS